MGTAGLVMKYSWKALPIAGVAALRDELGNNAGLIYRSENFVAAYMARHNGAVMFKNIKGRYSLLGVYPSLKTAGRAVENEIRSINFGLGRGTL